MNNIETDNICWSLLGLLTLDEPTACPKPCMMGELEGLQQCPGWGRTDITATNESELGSRVAFAWSDPFVSDLVRDRVNIGTPFDMQEWTWPPGELGPSSATAQAVHEEFEALEELELRQCPVWDGVDVAEIKESELNAQGELLETLIIDPAWAEINTRELGSGDASKRAAPPKLAVVSRESRPVAQAACEEFEALGQCPWWAGCDVATETNTSEAASKAAVAISKELVDQSSGPGPQSAKFVSNTNEAVLGVQRESEG